MITNRFIIYITLAVATITHTSHIHATTGNELYKWLLDGKQYRGGFSTSPVGGALSIGYISGIGETLVRQGIICFPENSVTSGQMADIVFKVLESNPEYRHVGAAAIVAISLQDSFPCQK